MHMDSSQLNAQISLATNFNDDYFDFFCIFQFSTQVIQNFAI